MRDHLFETKKNNQKDLRTFINKMKDHLYKNQKKKKIGRKFATNILAPKTCIRDLRAFINKIRWEIICLKQKKKQSKRLKNFYK